MAQPFTPESVQAVRPEVTEYLDLESPVDFSRLGIESLLMEQRLEEVMSLSLDSTDPQKANRAAWVARRGQVLGGVIITAREFQPDEAA